METRPTHIIGRHIKADLPDLKRFDGCCAVCGGIDHPGWPIENVVTSTFADIDWLTGGRYVCEPCLKCLGQGQPRNRWVKNFSCLATEDELRILKREDLWEHLLNPPEKPFVLNITFAHKKHMSFKSRVNPGGSPYWVTSDIDTVLIDLDTIRPAIEIMQRWYTVCDTTKQRPTWFTKNDIARGATNFKRIERYGANRYLREDSELERFRGTHALEILLYALNKKESEVEG